MIRRRNPIVIGNNTSTRPENSAASSRTPQYTSGSPRVFEIENPRVFEEAADDVAQPDVFAQAFTPAIKQQVARTMRSIFTPACEAAYKPSIVTDRTSLFIFA